MDSFSLEIECAFESTVGGRILLLDLVPQYVQI